MIIIFINLEVKKTILQRLRNYYCYLPGGKKFKKQSERGDNYTNEPGGKITIVLRLCDYEPINKKYSKMGEVT